MGTWCGKPLPRKGRKRSFRVRPHQARAPRRIRTSTMDLVFLRQASISVMTFNLARSAQVLVRDSPRCPRQRESGETDCLPGVDSSGRVPVTVAGFRSLAIDRSTLPRSGARRAGLGSTVMPLPRSRAPSHRRSLGTKVLFPFVCGPFSRHRKPSRCVLRRDPWGRPLGSASLAVMVSFARRPVPYAEPLTRNMCVGARVLSA